MKVNKHEVVRKCTTCKIKVHSAKSSWPKATEGKKSDGRWGKVNVDAFTVALIHTCFNKSKQKGGGCFISQIKIKLLCSHITPSKSEDSHCGSNTLITETSWLRAIVRCGWRILFHFPKGESADAKCSCSFLMFELGVGSSHVTNPFFPYKSDNPHAKVQYDSLSLTSVSNIMTVVWQIDYD